MGRIPRTRRFSRKGYPPYGEIFYMGSGSRLCSLYEKWSRPLGFFCRQVLSRTRHTKGQGTTLFRIDKEV